MGPETVDWTYAISTLLIRFVGIFVVLGVLQVVMQITGRIFSHLDAKRKSEALTQEQAAAVAIALRLYDGND